MQPGVCETKAYGCIPWYQTVRVSVSLRKGCGVFARKLDKERTSGAMGLRVVNANHTVHQVKYMYLYFTFGLRRRILGRRPTCSSEYCGSVLTDYWPSSVMYLGWAQVSSSTRVMLWKARLPLNSNVTGLAGAPWSCVVRRIISQKAQASFKILYVK